MAIDTGQTNAVVNVTPMIDVLLVLLIIFMAITPTSPNGLDAAIPSDASDAVRPPDQPIVLEVAADGSYKLNTERVSASLLGDRLTSVFLRRGERVLFLKAAATLEYSAVAAVIDTAHGVGIDHVALMPR